MQLTIKSGKREVTLLKPELRKLRAAQDVLDGLCELVDGDAETEPTEARKALQVILTRYGAENGKAT